MYYIYLMQVQYVYNSIDNNIIIKLRNKKILSNINFSFFWFTMIGCGLIHHFNLLKLYWLLLVGSEIRYGIDTYSYLL